MAFRAVKYFARVSKPLFLAFKWVVTSQRAFRLRILSAFFSPFLFFNSSKVLAVKLTSSDEEKRIEGKDISMEIQRVLTFTAMDSSHEFALASCPHLYLQSVLPLSSKWTMFFLALLIKAASPFPGLLTFLVKSHTSSGILKLFFFRSDATQSYYWLNISLFLGYLL